MSNNEINLVCGRCKETLVPQKTVFHYMNLRVNASVPKCPACGLVYLSEEMVRGKIRQLEMQLEEK